MEPIGKEIGRFLGKRQPGLSTTWSKKIRACDDCGREYEAKFRIVNGEEIFLNSYCDECQKKRMEAFKRNKALQELHSLIPSIRSNWLKESGLTKMDKFVNKTFENFERNRQPKAHDTVKNYSSGSLVLLSPEEYGLGKTHLVAALVNHLIATREPARITTDSFLIINRCPVLIIRDNKFLARIRATFNRRTGGPVSETEEEIYYGAENTPLLIIDDVGKIRPHDLSFVQGVYFRVLDHRYSTEKPVIMTTNLGFTELENYIGGACADRLREMCGKEGFIKMTGTSYRKR